MKTRVFRINTIFNVIKKCEIGAIKKQLIAECCMKWGICSKTVNEYLTTLINNNKIIEVNDRLKVKNGS